MTDQGDTPSTPDTKEDKVGYGRPPETTRFKKGQSGNPNGRPKRSRNLNTDLWEELNEKVPITENGKRKTITKQRAIVKKLVNTALSKDNSALRLLTTLIRDQCREASARKLESQHPPIDRNAIEVARETLRRVRAKALAREQERESLE